MGLHFWNSCQWLGEGASLRHEWKEGSSSEDMAVDEGRDHAGLHKEASSASLFFLKHL